MRREDNVSPRRWRGAKEHSRGRRFELFVEIEDEAVPAFQAPRRSDLIRLAGTDPDDGVSVEVFIEEVD